MTILTVCNVCEGYPTSQNMKKVKTNQINMKIEIFDA